jgi:hypothetical protein
VRRKVFKDASARRFDAFKTDADQMRFIRDFEVLVNTGVLGTPIRQANWRLAIAANKDNRQAIKDQTMPNTHVRKFLKQFAKLTAFCLPATYHVSMHGTKPWCIGTW